MRPASLALALLCALSVPSAFAADAAESAEAPKVKWVMPWKTGVMLEYASESTRAEEKAGVKSRERSTDTTQVRIIQASAEGYVQTWAARNPTFEVLEGDKSGEAAHRAALAELSDVVLEAKLDADGNYAGLANLDAVIARMRKAMRPVIALGAEAQLAKIENAAEREAARAKMRPQLDAALEGMLTPAIAEAMLTRIIQVYNGFVGIEVEPDQAYEVETELPNPAGGPGFPAKLTFSLSVSEDDPDDLFVAFDQTIDPEKAAAGALAIGEKIVGQKLDNTGKDAIRSIDIKDEGLFLVRRSTGVIEMFETTRTTSIGPQRKVERERLRLLNGDHDHVWRDEQEADAADDEVEAQEG